MLFKKIFCSSNISETWWYLRTFRYIFSLCRKASPLHWRRTFFSPFAFKLSNIPTGRVFLKVKGFAFRGAFTFYSRSRFYVAPLVPYVYIIRIGRVARKAGCDRWLVRRRIPRTHLIHTTHQPIYLPTYEHKFPYPLRSLSLSSPRSYARPKPLTCYKPSNVYSISVEGHALYTLNPFISLVMLERPTTLPPNL